MDELYLDGFYVGQKFGSGRLRVETDQIKAFAAEFDSQPFHLDEEAAKGSFFGGLAASGWHTAALTMRLLVTGDLKPAGGVIGASNEISWTRPVRPGDDLRVESEVLEVRPSKSRPEQGQIKVRSTTLNQKDEPVQVLTANLVVPRRPASAALTEDAKMGGTRDPGQDTMAGEPRQTRRQRKRWPTAAPRRRPTSEPTRTA
jgi:acyl dehydratase